MTGDGPLPELGVDAAYLIWARNRRRVNRAAIESVVYNLSCSIRSIAFDAFRHFGDLMLYFRGRCVGGIQWKAMPAVSGYDEETVLLRIDFQNDLKRRDVERTVKLCALNAGQNWLQPNRPWWFINLDVMRAEFPSIPAWEWFRDTVGIEPVIEDDWIPRDAGPGGLGLLESQTYCELEISKRTIVRTEMTKANEPPSEIAESLTAFRNSPLNNSGFAARAAGRGR